MLRNAVPEPCIAQPAALRTDADQLTVCNGPSAAASLCFIAYHLHLLSLLMVFGFVLTTQL